MSGDDLRAILLAPDSAAAHFYLGVNLGQLARTKLFTALGLLSDMETAWNRTVELARAYTGNVREPSHN